MSVLEIKHFIQSASYTEPPLGYYEMPPERDLRDTQPTISVNYRVIKNKAENETKIIPYKPYSAKFDIR